MESVESTRSDHSSNSSDKFLICRDNVDEWSIMTASKNVKKMPNVEQKMPNVEQKQMPNVEQKEMPCETTAFTAPHDEKDYQKFLMKPMRQALTEYWTRDTSQTYDQDEPLWNISNSCVAEYQADVEGCSMRVVSEGAFNNMTFSANFVTFTMSKCTPDIAVEICSKSVPKSNAILIIEVKFGEQTENDLPWTNLRRLMCYMVTLQRPVVKNSDGDYLLYGLLLYPSVAYQVELKSHVWLDYPWKCISIQEYSFKEYDVLDVLRSYIRAGLGNGKEMCKDELFKTPSELNFPRFPRNAEHKGPCGNVVKVKWSDVSEYFPTHRLKVSQFTRLPLVNVDVEVVVKVVSPTIYPNGSLEGFVHIAVLSLLLEKFSNPTRKLTSDEAVQKRIHSVADMYIHIGPRGENNSSAVVVTHFKGERVPSNPDLMQCWQAALSATAAEDVKARSRKLRLNFFNQVCLVALDFVQYVRYAHYDIRLANVVFINDNFALIDWEGMRSIARATRTLCELFVNAPDQRYPKIDVTEDTIRWLVYSAYQLYMVIFTIDMAAWAPAGEAKYEACAVEQAFRCEELWQHAEAEARKKAKAQSGQPSTSMIASKASNDVEENVAQYSQGDASTMRDLLHSQSANEMSSFTATKCNVTNSVATGDEADCLTEDDIASLRATEGDGEGNMANPSTDMAKDDFRTDKQSAAVTKVNLMASKQKIAPSGVDLRETFVKWGDQRKFTELCNVEHWNKYTREDICACRAELENILKVALQIEV